MEDENDLEELKLNKQSSSESTDYIPPDSLPSDDDDEDNFPSRSAHGIKYLSSGQIYGRVEQLLKDVASYGFQDEQTLLYLNYYNFDKERLIESIFQKMDEVNQTLKLNLWKLGQIEIIEEKDQQKTCTMCMNCAPYTSVTSLCGCNICIECWRDHILTNSKNNNGIIGCMNCPATIPKILIEQILSQSDFQFYQRALGYMYVQKKKSIKWCPGVGCDYAVEDDNRTEQYISCKCGTEFCFKCENGNHKPALCQEIKDWKIMIEKDDANVKWIMVNTKICPFCGKAVERSMGCNFMYCDTRASGCGQNFCYVCENPWEPDHKDHFKCNKYVPNQEKEKSKERENEILQRYNFYYQKFLAAQNSGKKAKQVFTKVKEWRDEIYNTLNIALQETEFLNDSFQVLIEAKNLLQHSYVFGYYLASNSPPHPKSKDLFEFFQGEFEKYCDNLAIRIEMDFQSRLLDQMIGKAKANGDIDQIQLDARAKFFDIQKEIVAYLNAAQTQSAQLTEQIETGKVYID